MVDELPPDMARTRFDVDSSSALVDISGFHS